MTSKTFRKTLSANDVGTTGGHMGGILIPTAHREGFITSDQLRRLATAEDQDGDLAKSGYGEHLLRFLEFEGR